MLHCRDKAAEQGDATAQFNLGAMYEDGRGVPQDFIQAHKWLNLAASRTTGILFEVYRHARDRVAGELSVSQRNTARKLAQEWQPKSWEELKEN